MIAEKLAVSGTHSIEMDPVIYIRVAKPTSKVYLQQLPCFKTDDYFEKEPTTEDK